MERILILFYITTLFSGINGESEVNDISATCTSIGREKNCLKCEDLKQEMYVSGSDRDTTPETFTLILGMTLCLIVSVIVLCFIVCSRKRRQRITSDEKVHVLPDPLADSPVSETTIKDSEDYIDNVPEIQDTGTNETTRNILCSVNPPDKQNDDCSVGSMRENSVSELHDGKKTSLKY